MNRAHPVFGELKVILGLAPVIVPVIEVADIEWRVGEDQIHPPFGAVIQDLDRVAMNNLIGLRHAAHCREQGGSRKSYRTFSHACQTVNFDKPFVNACFSRIHGGGDCMTLRPVSYNRPSMAQGMNGAVLRLLDANSNRARKRSACWRTTRAFCSMTPLSAGPSKTCATIWRQRPMNGRLRPSSGGTRRAMWASLTKPQPSCSAQDLADVVIAAGKRLGEALRAIEEYLKIVSPADSAKVENARYRFYDLEKRIAFTLQKPGDRFARCGCMC